MKTQTIAGVAACVLLANTLPCIQEAHAQDDVNIRCVTIPQSRGFRLDLLVDGMPLRQIRRGGRIYVEAPWDSDFDIRITCPAGARYLAVCSVDGLSIMTGKTASSLDDGYVIDNGNLTIPGFRLNNSNVAHFHFGDKSKSYANLMDKPTNIGVIGLKMFADANRREYVPYAYESSKVIDNAFPRKDVKSDERPIVDSAPSADQVQSQTRDKLYDTNTLPLAAGASSQSANFIARGQERRPSGAGLAPSRLDHDMGTEFGTRTAFATQEVEFNRGRQVASFAIEYASHEKLVQAGILPGESLPTHPNPFPGDSSGCTPPPGWRG